jgi:hypothetical protein
MISACISMHLAAEMEAYHDADVIGVFGWVFWVITSVERGGKSKDTKNSCL